MAGVYAAGPEKSNRSVLSSFPALAVPDLVVID
jgi:hypothetical protein